MNASRETLAVLLGLCVALAACSVVTGRAPVPDPSVDLRGPERLRGHRVVALAMKHRGVPYRWGGAGPSGFDCSGFVRHVYAQVGISLPHNAALQYQHGTPVSLTRLEPGDLVFFDRLRHNGIYIGDGYFIHARRAGKRVSVGRLDEPWYRSRWVGARRLQRAPTPREGVPMLGSQADDSLP